VVNPCKHFAGIAAVARFYRLNLKAASKRPLPAYSEDRLARLKAEYEVAAKEPPNLRYGYARATQTAATR
jgi:hypothetical protein